MTNSKSIEDLHVVVETAQETLHFAIYSRNDIAWCDLSKNNLVTIPPQLNCEVNTGKVAMFR